MKYLNSRKYSTINIRYTIYLNFSKDIPTHELYFVNFYLHKIINILTKINQNRISGNFSIFACNHRHAVFPLPSFHSLNMTFYFASNNV